MAAGLFVKPNGGRWVSLPARSHPMTRKLEEDLNKLKSTTTLDVSSCAFKADKLCNSISGLGNLYKSIADLLKQPLSQQALSSRYQDSQRCVDDLLQDSVTFLDVCGNTRDQLPNVRANVANLQSCLVKRSINNNGRESLCLENGVLTDYFNSIKSLQREMGKSLVSLKQTDDKLRHYYCGMSNGKDNSCSNELLVAVVRVLSETSFMTSLVFRSIMDYFSAAGASQTTKVSKQWSLVLRFVHNAGRHTVDNGMMNEFEDVEASMNCLMFPKSNRQAEGATTAVLIESVRRKLNVLETILERLEKELECLFRELIQARVSFLNILSHHS